LPKRPELIEQLLPYNSLMMVAGQFQVGKTSELLHLMHCFAYGSTWHGLQVEPAVAFYLTWEGTPKNLGSRIEKIAAQYEHLPMCYPWYIRMEPRKIHFNTAEGRARLATLMRDLNPKPTVLLIDPFKRTVAGNYSLPEVADGWIIGADTICHELDCAIIISAHTNKIIYRKDNPPDELDASRVKGAGDLLDGVSASLLIAEEKGYKSIKRPDGYYKTTWTSFGHVIKVLKARDATSEFPLLRVQLNRDLLRFWGEKWVIVDNQIGKMAEEPGQSGK